MEFVLAAIAAVSLALNYALVRQFKSYKVDVPVNVVLEYSFEAPSSTEPEPESIATTSDHVTVESPINRTQAWSNRTNIPWNETHGPTPKPVQQEASGPMERPKYGFV